MSGWTSLSSFGSTKESNKFKSVSSITELASFLQVIRSLQDRLQAKRRGPNRGTKVRFGDSTAVFELSQSLGKLVWNEV
jgi:hypothetical protein